MADTLSYERKFERALEHMDSLNAQVRAWIKRNRHAFTNKDDPDTGEVVWTYRGTTDPPDLSGVVGDALQNFRSVLDHLALSLAVAHSGPLSDEAAEDVAFPILWNPPTKDSEALWRKRIGLLSDEAQTVIKGLQPHVLGADYKSHPLWVLHELARIDRHRTLWTIVVPLVGESQIGGDNVFIEHMTLSGSRKPGTEVARYKVRPFDPKRKMQVKIGFSVNVTFAEGHKAGEPPTVTLLDLRNYLIAKVIGPLQPFLGP